MSACIADHDERGEAIDGLMVCARHRRRMDHDVREIGLLIVDTQRIVDGGAPQDDGPRGKSPKKRADPPAPGDTAIMALFDPRTKPARLPDDQSTPIPAVLSVVASWLQLVAEERPLTAELPRSVLAQLDLLARHHEWLAAQLWVDDYLLEMTELRKGLASVVRDHSAKRIGTCDLPTEDGPRCGGALLVDNGSDIIRCVVCKAQWVTADEQARLAVRLG